MNVTCFAPRASACTPLQSELESRKSNSRYEDLRIRCVSPSLQNSWLWPLTPSSPHSANQGCTNVCVSLQPGFICVIFSCRWSCWAPSIFIQHDQRTNQSKTHPGLVFVWSVRCDTTTHQSTTEGRGLIRPRLDRFGFLFTSSCSQFSFLISFKNRVRRSSDTCRNPTNVHFKTRNGFWWQDLLQVMKQMCDYRIKTFSKLN